MPRKKQTDPQTIREPLKGAFGIEVRIDGYDLEGSPDDVIAKMEALKAENPGKRLILDWHREPYSDDYALYVYVERLETPEEVEKRVATAKAEKHNRDERERREFERLAKKFGKAD